MLPSEVEKIFRAFVEKRKAELPRFTPDGIPITQKNKFDDGIYAFLYNYWKEHSGEYDPKGNVVASNTANHLSLEYKTENELKFAQWAMREYGMTNKERTTHTFKGQMSVLLEVWNVVDMITLPISLVSAGGKFIGKEVAKEVGEELGEKAVKEVAEDAVEKTVKKETAEEVAENTAKKEIEIRNMMQEYAQKRLFEILNTQSKTSAGPCLSEIYDPLTGNVAFGQNFKTSATGKAQYYQWLENDADPFIKELIKNYENEIKNGKVLLSEVADTRLAAHSEIVALDKILKNRRALGLTVDESTLSELYLYNIDLTKAYKSGQIVPKIRCEHCRYLTNGINILEHN